MIATLVLVMMAFAAVSVLSAIAVRLSEISTALESILKVMRHGRP